MRMIEKLAGMHYMHNDKYKGKGKKSAIYMMAKGPGKKMKGGVNIHDPYQGHEPKGSK